MFRNFVLFVCLLLSCSVLAQTVPISQLPVPASGSSSLTTGDKIPATRSGVTYGLLAGFGGSCPTNQWVSTINSQGVPVCTQPGYSNLAGSLGTLSLLNVTGLITYGGGQQSTGTTFTITSGCGTTTLLTGGATTGSFKAGQTSCIPIIALPTATNGWICNAWDITTNTDTLKQTAYSTNSCTLSGTVVNADVIIFHAEGF